MTSSLNAISRLITTYDLPTISSNVTTLTNTVITIPPKLTAGTFGSGTQIPVIVVNSNGNISSVNTITISSSGGGSLSTTGTNTGTFGSASEIPIITVDAYGRITNINKTTPSFDANAITAGVLPTGRGGTGTSSTTGNGSVVFANNPTLAGTVTVNGSLVATSISGQLATSSLVGTLSTSLFPTSGANAGTFGSTSLHPVITVDAYGRITSANTAIPSLDASVITSGILPTGRGGTGTNSVTGNGNLVLANNPTLAGTVTVSGSLSATSLSGQLQASSITGTLSTSLFPTSGTTTGTFGSASLHPVITVDAYGRITSASTATPSLDASVITSGILPTGRGGTGTTSTTGTGSLVFANNPTISGTLTVSGNITATSISAQVAASSITGTLSTTNFPTSGTNTGTFGSSSAIPVLTIDAYGRITSVSTQSLGSTSLVQTILYASNQSLTNSSNIIWTLSSGSDVSVNSDGTLVIYTTGNYQLSFPRFTTGSSDPDTTTTLQLTIQSTTIPIKGYYSEIMRLTANDRITIKATSSIAVSNTTKFVFTRLS